MRRLACMAVLAAAFASGCSTYGTREFPYSRTASTYLGAASEKGLTLSAEALIRPDRAERYLWFDTTSWGYLPVVVRAKNISQSAFRIDRARVQCVLSDGTSMNAAPVGEVITRMQYKPAGAIPYAVFGIFPCIWSLIHRSACNTDLAADYEEKHFFVDRSAVRIGTDDRLVGVVFFKLDKPRRPDLTDAVLEVRIVKERGPEGGDVEELVLRPQVE